jgi:hypothetical protein
MVLESHIALPLSVVSFLSLFSYLAPHSAASSVGKTMRLFSSSYGLLFLDTLGEKGRQSQITLTLCLLFLLTQMEHTLKCQVLSEANA